MLYKRNKSIKKYYRNCGNRYYFNTGKKHCICKDGTLKIFCKSNNNYINKNKRWFGYKKYNKCMDSFNKYFKLNIHNIIYEKYENKHYRIYGLFI